MTEPRFEKWKNDTTDMAKEEEEEEEDFRKNELNICVSLLVGR